MGSKKDQKHKKEVIETQTNMYDVLITIINRIFNLFTVEGIICLVVVYFLGRDAFFAAKARTYSQIKELMLSQDFLELLLNNDNILITVLVAIIAILLVVIFTQIFVVQKVYKKEIDRLSDIRSELLHDIDVGDFTTLRRHHSTEA